MFICTTYFSIRRSNLTHYSAMFLFYVSPPHVLQSSPASPSFPSQNGHYAHDDPQPAPLLKMMQALASNGLCPPSASSIDLVYASHIRIQGRGSLRQVSQYLEMAQNAFMLEWKY